MKDAYEVLYQKESDLARVREEVESLTIAASLLADDEVTFFNPDATHPDGKNKKPAEKAMIPLPPGTQATGTDSTSPSPRPTGFWGSLKRRR